MLNTESLGPLVYCLLVGACLPFCYSVVAGFYRQRDLGVIDNQHPRKQYSLLNGAGSRAVAAQKNAWEALAFFTAAVVGFALRSSSSEWAPLLGYLWVGFRVLHGLFYLLNQATLRTCAFSASFLCAVALFFV